MLLPTYPTNLAPPGLDTAFLLFPLASPDSRQMLDAYEYVDRPGNINFLESCQFEKWGGFGKWPDSLPGTWRVAPVNGNSFALTPAVRFLTKQPNQLCILHERLGRLKRPRLMRGEGR